MSGLAGLNSLNRARSAFAHVAGALLVLAALLLPGAAVAQQFPALSGRVVDAANVIPPDEEARLTQKLALLETQSHRQLVVATIPDLQGYDIADYGYQLGRAWGIGSKDKNDGALLIVAPNERKLRIEVGYGLEGVLTDGLSSLHSDRVTFGFTTPSRPAVLRPTSEDGGTGGGSGPFPAAKTDYVYLLMPVRLPG